MHAKCAGTVLSYKGEARPSAEPVHLSTAWLINNDILLSSLITARMQQKPYGTMHARVE